MKIIIFLLYLLPIIYLQQNNKVSQKTKIVLEQNTVLQNIQQCTKEASQYSTQVKSCLSQLDIVQKERNNLQTKLQNNLQNQQTITETNQKEYQFQIDFLQQQNQLLQKEIEKKVGISEELNAKSYNTNIDTQVTLLLNNVKDEFKCQKFLLEIQDQVQKLNQEKQNLQNQSEKSKFYQDQYQQLQIKVLNLERLNNELKEQNSKQTLLLQENKGLQLQIQNFKSEIQQQQSTINIQNTQINNLQQQQIQNQTQYEQQLKSRDQANQELQKTKSDLQIQNERIQIEINDFKNEKQRLLKQNQELQQNFNQIKISNSKNITELKEKQNQCNNQVAKQEIINKQKDKQILELNLQINNYQSQKDENKVIQNTITSLNIQIELLQNENTNLKQIVNTEQDKNKQCQQNLEIQIQSLQQDQNNIQQKLDQKEQTILSLKDEINQYKTYYELYQQCKLDKEKIDQQLIDLQFISTTVENLVKQNEEYRTLNNNLREEISILSGNLNNLKNSIQETQIANQNLVTIIEKQNFNDNLTKYNELMKDFAICEAKSQQYEDQVLILEKLNKSIQDLQKQVLDSENECQYIYTQNQDLQNKVDNCQINLENTRVDNVKKLQDIQDLENYKIQTEILRQQIDRLKNVIDLINTENSRIVVLERQLQETMNENDELRENQFNYEAKITVSDQNILQCSLKQKDYIKEIENINQQNIQQKEKINLQIKSIQDLENKLSQLQSQNKQICNCDNTVSIQNYLIQIKDLQNQIEYQKSQDVRQKNEIQIVQRTNIQLQDTLKNLQLSYSQCQTNNIEQNKQISKIQLELQQKQNEIMQLKSQKQKMKDQYDIQIIIVKEQSTKITKMEERLDNNSQQIETIRKQNNNLSQQNESLLTQSNVAQNNSLSIEQCNFDLQLIKSQKLSAEQQLTTKMLEINQLIQEQELCIAVKEQRNKFADEIAILRENIQNNTQRNTTNNSRTMTISRNN